MKRVSNMIDELDNYIPTHHRSKVIESRAVNAISSATNVLALIKEHYPDDYEDLLKKLLLAIKNGEPKRFTNKMKQIGDRENDRT